MKNLSFYIIFFVLVSISCNQPSYRSGEVNLQFVTWEDPCFDRCASICLIQNYIDSTATFDFIEFGKKVNTGIPFDVPGAELGRQGNLSCFETVLRKYKIDDHALVEMSKIVHDIDVNKWGIKAISTSDSLSLEFEKLKEKTENESALLELSEALFNSMYLNQEMPKDG